MFQADPCIPGRLQPVLQVYLFQLPTKGSTFILILKHFNFTIHPFSPTQKLKKTLRHVLIFFCDSLWGVWFWIVLFTLPVCGWCCWTWSRFTQIRLLRGSPKITGKGWGWQLHVFHAGSSGNPKFNPKGSGWLARVQNCKQRYSNSKPLDWECGQIQGPIPAWFGAFWSKPPVCPIHPCLFMPILEQTTCVFHPSQHQHHPPDWLSPEPQATGSAPPRISSAHRRISSCVWPQPSRYCSRE